MNTGKMRGATIKCATCRNNFGQTGNIITASFEGCGTTCFVAPAPTISTATYFFN